MKYIIIVIHLFAITNTSAQELIKKQIDKVSSLTITTLSTMLADHGIGEWGYSALIEADSFKILFDTGNRPETVLQNARELGIDLSDVKDVFLSHNHGDHVGGLLTLREELKKINPDALSRVHVGKGIFLERLDYVNQMWAIKEKLEKDGVEFIQYDTKKELFPGIWITGPIERMHDERNWYEGGKIKTEQGIIEDNIPEDQSIAIATSNGFVLVSGCGHAGVVNTIEQIRSDIYDMNLFAIIGGFHLVQASDEQLEWTAEKLLQFGVSRIIGAHCTGINALYTLRNLLGLDRTRAVVGSVGDRFDLENGIRAGSIAK